MAAAALLVLAGVVWHQEPLAAHAELLRTEPAAGAILPSAPPRVRLWFSEPVDPAPDAVLVFGPDGARVDGHDSRIVPGDEGGLDVSLDAGAQGTYAVRWRAISADSHAISGEFRFSVGQASAIVPAAVGADAQRAGGAVRLQAFARWLHLLGLALLVGHLTLLTLTVRTADIQALQTSLWRGSAWGTGLLLAASVLLLTAQATAIEGSVANGLRLAALNGLLHTRWGALWIVRVGLVAVAAAVTYVAGRRAGPTLSVRWWLGAAIVVSAGMVALTTLNSHSAATMPVWLSLIVDWVHVAATVVWVGGLFSLATILLPGVSRLSPGRRQAVLAPLASRFSRLALVSVELLIVTGLYHAWAHVSGPGALVATPYGRTLLIKLLLILVMLLPAAFNRFVARPRLAGARAPASEREKRRFSRAVGVEAGIAALVLATVGVLTSLAPARSVASTPVPERVVAAEPVVTLAAPAGVYLVTLTIGPGRLGSNHLEALVQDTRGASVGGAQVKFRISPPGDSQIPAWAVAPAIKGDRHEATVAFSPGGRWGVDVEVTADAATSSAAFSFAVPFLGAGEILAAATERMNRLRSVHEEIDVVVDGARSTEPAERLAPLDYRWLESATDVLLLGRDTIAGEECFDIGYVDTRDGSRVRVWIATQTLLVLQRSSAVPGHVQISRFSRFVGPSLTVPSTSRR